MSVDDCFDYDFTEKVDFYCSSGPPCGDCHTPTDASSLYDVWTDDGRRLLLCEECAAKIRALEALADQLLVMPSCQERLRIIDCAISTADLVKALRAHDEAQCVYCASTRKTIHHRSHVTAPAAVGRDEERIA
jgi:hypothetical protein